MKIKKLNIPIYYYIKVFEYLRLRGVRGLECLEIAQSPIITRCFWEWFSPEAAVNYVIGEMA